jgi:flagellar hook protein FlgE
MDNEGYLVTSHGYYVMGYEVRPYIRDTTTGVFTEIPIADINDPAVYDPDTMGALFWRSDMTEWMSQPPASRGPEPKPMAIKLTDEQVGFSVDSDGMINIIQDNRRLPIFQLTLGMFANPEGLEKVGNSLYRESPSSGESQLTVAKNNGAGSVSGGGLEMSNVDLAAEFTDMIVTQRGFQANSRVITVSDTMLEELINLKR